MNVIQREEYKGYTITIRESVTLQPGVGPLQGGIDRLLFIGDQDCSHLKRGGDTNDKLIERAKAEIDYWIKVAVLT
jgi:hypothetical protein